MFWSRESARAHVVDAAGGLLPGDILRVVTPRGGQVLLEAPAAGRCSITYPMPGPGFARVEILRPFLPGLPISASSRGDFSQMRDSLLSQLRGTDVAGTLK